MTDAVHNNDYFAIDRNVLVTVTIDGIAEIGLVDF